jgi:hypothetical protein
VWILRFAALCLIANQIVMAQEQPKLASSSEAAPPQQSTKNSFMQQLNPPVSSLGTISRRSYFFPDIATSAAPLTPRQKFELFAEKSIAPPTVLGAAAAAGFDQARNSYPEYGQGFDGYGRRFGAAMAGSASSNFFGTFVISTILHEDPRHFVRVDVTARARIEYALTRQVIGRTDGGQKTINFARIFGPLAAEALANVYLPQQDRTVGNTFERYGTRMSWGIADTLLKEYWPSIFKSLGMSKLSPEKPSDPNAVP